MQASFSDRGCIEDGKTGGISRFRESISVSRIGIISIPFEWKVYLEQYSVFAKRGGERRRELYARAAAKTLLSQHFRRADASARARAECVVRLQLQR